MNFLKIACGLIVSGLFACGCVSLKNDLAEGNTVSASAGTLFISHRGESSKAPENTLAAYRYAMENGADGMETDIHLTADKVLVCCHDCSLKHVFGEDMRIEDHTYAELQNYTAKPHADVYPDEHLAKFSDALKLLKPGRLFVVEIKDNDPAVVDAMVEEIKKASVPSEQITVISFQWQMVKYSKETYPEYKALYLCSFPKKDGEFLYTRDSYVKTLKDIHADGINCMGDPDFQNEEFYTLMHDAGMEVWVWTIDDTELARHFFQDGVNGITSNRAVELKTILEN